MKLSLILISIVILAMACRREEESTTTAASETAIGTTAVAATATQPPPAEAPPAPLVTDTAAATTGTTATTATTIMPPDKQTHVRLTEYRIEMPDTLTAGPTIFHVMNEGRERHSFEVEGEGIERALDRELDPGATGTLRVDLRPGSYRVYCPVEDHATRHRMTRRLTVR